MEAVDGDGTPGSYMSASIFAREVKEFGVFWHGIWWGTHEILDENMFHSIISEYKKRMKWKQPKPKGLVPLVSMDEEICTIQFYTYSDLYPSKIYHFIDTYNRDRYVFKTDMKVLVECGGGYIP